MSLRRLLTNLLATRAITNQPGLLSVVVPTQLNPLQRWETHFIDPAALETVRRLLTQDYLRDLDRQRTYLTPCLIELAMRLIPEKPRVVVLTHESWVIITYALVTYEVTQKHLKQIPLLADDDPLSILIHLASIRDVLRLELKPTAIV